MNITETAEHTYIRELPNWEIREVEITSSQEAWNILQEIFGNAEVSIIVTESGEIWARLGNEDREGNP